MIAYHSPGWLSLKSQGGFPLLCTSYVMMSASKGLVHCTRFKYNFCQSHSVCPLDRTYQHFVDFHFLPISGKGKKTIIPSPYWTGSSNWFLGLFGATTSLPRLENVWNHIDTLEKVHLVAKKCSPLVFPHKYKKYTSKIAQSVVVSLIIHIYLYVANFPSIRSGRPKPSIPVFVDHFATFYPKNYINLTTSMDPQPQ